MAKAFDYTGQRFGKLTAVSRQLNSGGKTMWSFSCDCGGQLVARMDHVAGGSTTSCGCAAHARTGEDQAGKRFTRLVALERADDRKGKTFWRFRCDCGQETIAALHHVQSGATRSCGCYAAERKPEINRTHGHTAGRETTPTFMSWQSMLRRCRDPNAVNYCDYGGRGIAVCERWATFENFLADMGERPAGKTLDRKDNDAGYEPGNCRWATAREQALNKRPRSACSSRPKRPKVVR